MTVKELRDLMNAYYEYNGDSDDDKRVCVVVSQYGIGGTPVSDVKHAGMGFDWDSEKFMLTPNEPLVKKNIIT